MMEFRICMISLPGAAPILPDRPSLQRTVLSVTPRAISVKAAQAFPKRAVQLSVAERISSQIPENPNGIPEVAGFCRRRPRSETKEPSTERFRQPQADVAARHPCKLENRIRRSVLPHGKQIGFRHETETKSLVERGKYKRSVPWQSKKATVKCGRDFPGTSPPPNLKYAC